MSGLLARRAKKAVAGGFTDPTDIGWHSLFWASGPEFEALGLTNGDTSTSWPNEVTAESDLAGGSWVYRSARSDLNNEPSFERGGNGMQGTFASAPTYPLSWVLIYDITSGSNPQIVTDGASTSARNVLWGDGGKFNLLAGGSNRAGSASWATGAYGQVATFDGSTGADTLRINGAGSYDINADAGSNQVAGITLGSTFGFAAPLVGSFALVGLYEGNVESDSLWGDFQSWASTTYGVSI